MEKMAPCPGSPPLSAVTAESKCLLNPNSLLTQKLHRSSCGGDVTDMQILSHTHGNLWWGTVSSLASSPRPSAHRFEQPGFGNGVGRGRIAPESPKERHRHRRNDCQRPGCSSETHPGGGMGERSQMGSHGQHLVPPKMRCEDVH